MRWRSCVVAVVAPLVVVSGALAARPDPRLRSVHTWAFAIGDGDLRGPLIRRYSAYDLLVIDGEGARRWQVAQLHRAGKLVLGYLDVGTIEPWRSWYGLLKPYRLSLWGDWGEWYANLNARGFRRAIVSKLAPALLLKGLDGLFLDNTDMVESHPRQTPGMRLLVQRLADLVHRRGMLLFTQNGEDSIGPTLRYYDGWNREDVTSTYDFARRRYVLQPRSAVRDAQRALRRIAGRGLLVLATDYTAAGDRAGIARSVSDACAAGALPFVSNIGLTRVAAVAWRCGGGGAAARGVAVARGVAAASGVAVALAATGATARSSPGPSSPARR